MSNLDKKYKQCPHCRSKKGFKIIYTIVGNGYEDIGFDGKVINCFRETFDKDEDSVICLNCNLHIDSDKLNFS